MTGVFGLSNMVARLRFAHMPRNELIGSLEASVILEVDRATFNRWAQSGRITAAFVCAGVTGPRLFHRADIEHLARAKSRTKAPAA